MSSNTQPPQEIMPTMSEWRDYQLFVTSTLSEVKDDMKAIKSLLHEQDKEIDRLKLKSGIWGLMGGFLSGIGLKVGTWIF